MGQIGHSLGVSHVVSLDQIPGLSTPPEFRCIPGDAMTRIARRLRGG
jgi:hypothetical protein